MSRKALVILVLCAILAQILIFCYFEKDNIAMVDRRVVRIQERQRMVSSEKTMLEKQYKTLKEVVANIPARLLTGFEDPEVSLFEFLDALPGTMESPESLDVEAKVEFGKPKFLSKPIPLHETEFTFNYRFNSTYQAEKFLNKILYQDQLRWPLRVKSIAAKKAETGVAGGQLKVDLLIPAKLHLPPPPKAGKSSEAK